MCLVHLATAANPCRPAPRVVCGFRSRSACTRPRFKRALPCRTPCAPTAPASAAVSGRQRVRRAHQAEQPALRVLRCRPGSLPAAWRGVPRALCLGDRGTLAHLLCATPSCSCFMALSDMSSSTILCALCSCEAAACRHAPQRACEHSQSRLRRGSTPAARALLRAPLCQRAIAACQLVHRQSLDRPGASRSCSAARRSVRQRGLSDPRQPRHLLRRHPRSVSLARRRRTRNISCCKHPPRRNRLRQPVSPSPSAVRAPLVLCACIHCTSACRLSAPRHRRARAAAPSRTSPSALRRSPASALACVCAPAALVAAPACSYRRPSAACLPTGVPACAPPCCHCRSTTKAPDVSCICAQHRVHLLTLRAQSSRLSGEVL